MGGQTRKADQKVDTFSAPIVLLRKAAQKAIMMRMTKSGFYRYCLAKECGYSEEDALHLGQHRGLILSLERQAKLNEGPDKPYGQNQTQSKGKKS